MMQDNQKIVTGINIEVAEVQGRYLEVMDLGEREAQDKLRECAKRLLEVSFCPWKFRF
jgi:hypothetical protein